MTVQAARALARHPVALLRTGVLALAALLRFLGIGFAPSTPWGRPDEEIFATVALRLFSESSPHSAETGWPELWFRVHYLVQAFLRWLWTSRYGVDPDLGCVMTISPARMLVPVRIVTAALSVGTVWLVMCLARRVGPRTLTPREREAISLIAGLVYAVDVLVMRDAHFAVSDQALLFFLAWMLLAAARGLDQGRVIDFASCGIALGLAIGTKWTGLTFGVIPVLALAMRFRRLGAHPSNIVALLVGTAATMAAFLLTNPSFLTSAQPFLDGLAGQAMRYDPNAPQVFTIYEHAPIEFGLIRHLRVSLPFALGWPLTVAALIGTLAMLGPWARRGRGATFIVGFFTVLFHVVVAGRTMMYFGRYSLPIHPGLAVASGVVIVLGARAIARLRAVSDAEQRTLASRIAVALTLILVAEPTYRSVAFDLALMAPETRELVARYVHTHIGNEPVDVSGGYSRVYGVPPLLADRCEQALPPQLRTWVMRLGTASDPVGLVRGTPASWPVVSHQAIIGEVHGPYYPYTSDWALMTLPYLPCDQPVQRFGADEPGACYHEVARFEPEGIACDAMWDDQDHLYAPLWGWEASSVFSSFEHARIGPSVVLYHDECASP